MNAIRGDLVETVCKLATGVRGDVTDVVTNLVDEVAPLIPVAVRRHTITAAVARLAGLDALEIHLADDTVDEVMVNSGRHVWIDRNGVIEPAGELPAGTIDVVLERVLSPIGKRVDRMQPIVDVRLRDGSRLCAVIEPVAVDGTTVSIRRHRPAPFTILHFIEDRSIADLMQEVVSSRCNVLVSGATSSGKTSFLSALLRLTGGQRVVVCEDTTELSLPGLHCVRLEARRATADGVPAVDMSSLVRTALRLRPDRLVVGEFRGGEVLAAVEAMNTGHDGSLATCHANSAVDALRRVETLLMQAAPSWPLPAIRRHVTRSIDVVVHIERDVGGRRRVAEIAEVIEGAGEPAVRTLRPAAGDRLQRSRRQ